MAAGRITVGRDPDNDVVLSSRLVSGRHCMIEARPEGHALVDLASFSGTFVNGVSVGDRILAPDDLVTIGDDTLRVSSGRLRRASVSGGASLRAKGLTVDLPGGRRLLDGVDFELGPGSLLAVVGPSGAGKTTLFRVLTGATRPTSGEVICSGLDLHDHASYFRSRIGVVPQDDVIHRSLGVERSLTYAARLRFPPDLTDEARAEQVRAAIVELQLDGHEETVVSRLSGGQRKRTSMAMEILTSPQFLFLDEPTSGLDPGLDKSVMETLRVLADAGRTIVVITHNVANLDLCDRVLMLAPGGRPVFFDSPNGIGARFGTTDFARIFTGLPDEQAIPPAVPRAAESPAADRRDVTTPRLGLATLLRSTATGLTTGASPLRHQIWTLLHRQLRLMVADRSFAVFSICLPVALGLLGWAVPGPDGLATPEAPSTQSMQTLVILVVGALFMGMSASIRDLVGERAIYHRERTVGLSPAAYLIAKLVFFSGLAAAQTTVCLIVFAIGRRMPDHAAFLPSGSMELWVSLTLTAISGAALGLLVSATVSTSEQVMPILVMAVMGQMVLCGGLLPVAGRAGLAQLALLAPARWGYAASASSVGVLDALGRTREDALWEPHAWTWLLTCSVLMAMVAALSLLTLRRLVRH